MQGFLSNFQAVFQLFFSGFLADCQWIAGLKRKKRIFVCLSKTVIYNFSPEGGKWF